MAPSKKRTVMERKDVARRLGGTHDCPCLQRADSNGVCQLHEWLGTTIDMGHARKSHAHASPVRLLRPNCPVVKYKDCTLDSLSGYMYVMVLLNWVPLLSLFVAIYVVVVAIFALLFAACNDELAVPVATARDYFNLSVQTMATIGYGVLYPRDTCSNWIAVIESFVSMIVTSLMTGVAFVKFAKPRPHMMFSNVFTVSEREDGEGDGLELRFRIVNGTRRELIMKGEILEVSLKLILMRIEETQDGGHKLCYYDLHLKTTSYITLRLEAEIVHEIEEDSPFFGMTRHDVNKSDFLLILIMSGVDDTLHDMIHQRFEYSHEHMRWGAKFVPFLHWDRAENQIELDFDLISATVPSPIRETQASSQQDDAGATLNHTTLSTETEGNFDMGEELDAELQNVEEEKQDEEVGRLSHNNLMRSPSTGDVNATIDYSDLESTRNFQDDKRFVHSQQGGSTLDGGGESDGNTADEEEEAMDQKSVKSTETNSGSENEASDEAMSSRRVRFDQSSRTTHLRMPHISRRRRESSSVSEESSLRRSRLRRHEAHPALHEQPMSIIRRRVRFKNHPFSRLSKGLYYRALETSWFRLFLYLAFIYFFAIAFIAFLMHISGHQVLIETAEMAVDNKYERMFFFCAQTLSTIGYGALSPYPHNDFANFYVFVLAVAGMFVSAVVTGLAWAKFSIPKASSVIFSDSLLLTSFHSHRAIMFRAANSRTFGAIIEGSFRVSVVILNQRLGHKQTHELKLTRNVWPIVQLATTVTHIIDEDSPLFDISTDELLSGRHFFVVLFTGLDPIVGENMFSRKTYHSCDLLVGHHFVENMKIAGDGVHIDLQAINDTTIVPDNGVLQSRVHTNEASPAQVSVTIASTVDELVPSLSLPLSHREIEIAERGDTSPTATSYSFI